MQAVRVRAAVAGCACRRGLPLRPTPLLFAELDTTDRRTRLQFPGVGNSMRSLVAFTSDGTIAGELRWSRRGGEIAVVWVAPHRQRLGIATALLAEAVRRQPDVHHSTELSRDAEAWIASLQAS